MTDKIEREAEFWGPVEAGQLTAIDEDEAIESILDDYTDNNFPEKITICGYAHMKIDISYLNPLEHCIENLDEEYGDPDSGGYSDPTDAMKDAERVFLEVIKKEYQVWTCEPVCKKEIIVADWVKKNRPDWLEPQA